MPHPQQEQAPVNSFGRGRIFQDDLPTADSLFGNNAPFLSNLARRPIPDGMAKPVHEVTAVSSVSANFQHSAPGPSHSPIQSLIRPSVRPHLQYQVRPLPVPQHSPGRLQQPQVHLDQQQQESHLHHNQQQQQQHLHQYNLPRPHRGQYTPPQGHIPPLQQRPEESSGRSPALNPCHAQWSPPVPQCAEQHSPSKATSPGRWRDLSQVVSVSPADTTTSAHTTAYKSTKDILPSADVLFGGPPAIELFQPVIPPSQLPSSWKHSQLHSPTLSTGQQQPHNPHDTGRWHLMSVLNTSTSPPSPTMAPDHILPANSEIHTSPEESRMLPEIAAVSLPYAPVQSSLEHPCTSGSITQAATMGKVRTDIRDSSPSHDTHLDVVYSQNDCSSQQQLSETAQDSDSPRLFAVSPDTDTSKLFSGSSAVDSYAFFTDLSQQPLTEFVVSTIVPSPTPAMNIHASMDISKDLSSFTEESIPTSQNSIDTVFREEQREDALAINQGIAGSSKPDLATRDVGLIANVEDQGLSSHVNNVLRPTPKVSQRSIESSYPSPAIPEHHMRLDLIYNKTFGSQDLVQPGQRHPEPAVVCLSSPLKSFPEHSDQSQWPQQRSLEDQEPHSKFYQHQEHPQTSDSQHHGHLENTHVQSAYPSAIDTHQHPLVSVTHVKDESTLLSRVDQTSISTSQPPKPMQPGLSLLVSDTEPLHQALNQERTATNVQSAVSPSYILPPQPRVHLPSQTYSEQPMPFNNSLADSDSPAFDRDVMTAHESVMTRQSGSYSILELGSELAQAPYFPRTRQSPLLYDGHTGQAAFKSSNTQWWSTQQVESEASAFDQVSLTEDISAPTASTAEAISATSPPSKERGLASLLDPSTLSAVEDLLNMPKSAAFERGMSRLFKGVKSSATSIFTSPLTHSQSKAPLNVQGQEEEPSNNRAVALDDDMRPTSSSPVTVAPTQFITGIESSTSVPSLLQSKAAEHHEAVTSIQNLPLETIPPPPPPPPKASRRQFPDARPHSPGISSSPQPLSSQPATYDWAHKQVAPFEELFAYTSAEAATLDPDPTEPDSFIAASFNDTSGSVHEHFSTEGVAAMLVEAQEQTRDAFCKNGWKRPEGNAITLDQTTGGAVRTSDATAEEVLDHTSQSSLEQLPGDFEGLRIHSLQPFSSTNIKSMTPDDLPHQQSSNPSVLGQEALTRRQVAVSAFLVERVGGGGGRSNTDKKIKLLEKARELLEKRQQKSSHHSPPLVMRSRVIMNTFAAAEPGMNAEEPLPTVAHPTEDNRISLDLGRSQNNRHSFLSPVFTSISQEIGDSSQLDSPSTVLSLDGASHHCRIPTNPYLTENDQLKQEIATLLAKIKALEMERDSAANPKIQLQKSRDLIDDMHLDMQMEQTTLLRLSSDHSQQLNDLITENQRLRVELALSQGETKSQSVHADMLIQIQHLQQALQQAQNVHRRYQAAGPIEPEQLSDTLAENENLQQNPQPTQQQPKEHVPESIPLSITSDRETHFAEQLAREAELLRRQLKGQRVEMKELQYTVRRSEAEKRDLVSRIEYLERSLADAEKHRNELKSHQAMKDEAYKVIQERLVASFDEEKAQYMDEETFKLVKLEHRFNLLQDELQAVRAEQDKNDRGATQTTLRQSTIDEQLEGCQSVVALQEHVAQLETELAAAAALEASLRAQVVSLQVEAKEARTNEQDVRWTVASSEECMESMRRELTANVMFHSHRLVEMDAGAVDQSTTLASLASEPGRSLEQEAEFKRELEITSQAINKDILVSGSENSEQNNILQQIEYSRLAERASQWREDCLEAQEEKMRVEDQLQRVNMEFMAAKIEIDQLEASIRAAAETPTTEWAQQDLEQEATETKKEIMRLKGELRDRDRASETLSIRVQQLEHLQSENLRLKQALETTRGVEDAAKLEVYDHGNQSLHQLLEEERKVHSEQVDGLDKQLRRAQVLLLERQAEVEKTSLELNDMIYRLSKAEGDLSIFKERQSVEQDLTGNATETATLLQTQLDDITSKYFSFMQEISEKEASLNTALSTLEREKQRAEEQVRTLTGSITAHVEQNDILQREVCTLEQDLALTTAKMRTMQQEAESSRARVTEVENQVMTLQDSYRQAEVELELIVDLFGKLLDIPDEPEEIAALENTAVSMLTEIELLGVSAPLLPRVGARLIELQKAEVNNANRIHELEAELLQLRHIKPILGPSSQDSRPREALLDGDRDRDAEVENLKRDLARAEQGISRLQQFLQEFQNEKKAALYELEQRLENSDTEVAQARAQLAKAQAMLLSRPTNPSTPTQGAFLLMPQSPTLLQDKGPFQSPRQEQPYLPKMWQDAIDVALTDKMFMGTERIHHEAILALEPLRQQKSELERTLLDLRHRYELSQKENDALLSQLEKENQQLRARTERTSPDMSSEHLERIRELEEEHLELTRQLKTAQREHEFTRQDMKVLKAELGKLKPRA